MRRHRECLALVLAMAACAPLPRQVPVAAARAQLVGRPAASVAACLGPAPIQRSEGHVVLWTYPSPTATSSAPVSLADPAAANFGYTPYAGDPPFTQMTDVPLGAGEGPVAPAGCLLNVTVDSSVVRAVTYVGPNGHLLHDDPECSELVRACMP